MLVKVRGNTSVGVRGRREEVKGFHTLGLVQVSRAKGLPSTSGIFSALTLTLQNSKGASTPRIVLLISYSSRSTLNVKLSNNLKYLLSSTHILPKWFPHSPQFGSERPSSKAGKWQKQKQNSLPPLVPFFFLVGEGRRASPNFRILGFAT